jgi:hypothetical protein
VTRVVEPCDIGLGERHPGVETTEMAPVVAAGVGLTALHRVIVHDRRRDANAGPLGAPQRRCSDRPQGPGRRTPSSRVNIVVVNSPSRVAGSS